MKVLLDLTTPRPYAVWTMVEQMIQWRDDIFFYVVTSERVERTKFFQRIRLIPNPKYLNPWDHTLWDVDVVLTSTSTFLYNLRHGGQCILGKSQLPVRLFVSWEEIPDILARLRTPGHRLTTGELIIHLINEFETKTLEYIQQWGKDYLGEIEALVEHAPSELDLTAYFLKKGFFKTVYGNTPMTMLMRLLALCSGYKDTNRTGVLMRR